MITFEQWVDTVQPVWKPVRRNSKLSVRNSWEVLPAVVYLDTEDGETWTAARKDGAKFMLNYKLYCRVVKAKAIERHAATRLRDCWP